MITIWELLELGVARSTVRDWVRSGRLIRLYRGVYALGHDRLRPEGFWLAAVLACGPGAALSHAAAADVLDLRSSSARLLDVSTTSAVRPKPGIRLHRPRSLDGDVVECRGIPVTSPTRTLIDLARVLPLPALERVAGNAEIRGLIDHGRLARERSRKLRTIFGNGGPQVTRSPDETRMLEAVRAAGLPEPEMNVWMTHGGGEEWQADALWRRQRLIVEIDDDSHRTRHAFELDRHKDAIRQAAGYRTLRFTRRQVREGPAEVVALIARILALTESDLR